MSLKRIYLVAFAFLLFFTRTSSVEASLVKVTASGEVVWNVLAIEDTSPRESLTVVKSASGSPNDTLALKTDAGKYYSNDLDITNYKDKLIEIEERGPTKKITIGTDGDQFTIEQNGLVAKTSFPIIIRPQENELSITTSSGSVYISVLPIEATETAIRSRFISVLENNQSLELVEESGLLAYKIGGQKILNILNILDYKIPVTAHISASTGELLGVDGPDWFKIFGFLFS